jgi:3-deoxy-D-manno-octulosonate 8-phosphate phosphatase (KDO 8-P phosphatase)
MTGIREKFSRIGGTFLVSEDEIARELLKINVFVFDWDGVFNNGLKASERGSGFSEADAMGVNMLRYNHWSILKKLPLLFIITGENNPTSIEFAKREHFNAVYVQFLNKRNALQHIVENYSVSYNEMAFVFDDILDIDAGSLCKLAFCVNRNASPMFKEYIVKHKVCHYITAYEGGNHAVREISELLIGLTGGYNETITKRVEFGEDYKLYLSHRNLISTEIEKAQIQK